MEKPPGTPPASSLFETIDGRASLNLEAFDRAFEERDDTRIAQIERHFKSVGIDDGRIRHIFAARRARIAAHQRMDAEQRERNRTAPIPTDDEWSAGVFVEDLEPQVRDAVFALRRKGYATYSSGFDDWDYQSVHMEDALDLPPGPTKALEDMSVTVREKSLSFIPDDFDPERMREKWNRIVDLLPERDMPAPETDVPQAELFRRRHPRP